MRILVTNDDGVHAPGLAAIVRALAVWARGGSPSEDRQVVVVAPLGNYSGASSAVGTVYERESIHYKTSRIEGAEDVPTYGLDASPALSTIVGTLGGFGPRPDLVVSGINLGVNVGRSVLHSGTVGAVLTGAQLGLSGLAVSMRSGADVDHWETPATLAVALLDHLAAAPPRTVFNLNTPSLPLAELRGIRQGSISQAGIIKEASDRSSSRISGGPVDDEEEGEIFLRLGAAVPSLGDTMSDESSDDGALVNAGFASLTALVGVRQDTREEINDLITGAFSEIQSIF